MEKTDQEVPEGQMLLQGDQGAESQILRNEGEVADQSNEPAIKKSDSVHDPEQTQIIDADDEVAHEKIERKSSKEQAPKSSVNQQDGALIDSHKLQQPGFAYYDDLEHLGLATSRVIPEEDEYLENSTKKLQDSKKHLEMSPVKIAKKKSNPDSKVKKLAVSKQIAPDESKNITARKSQVQHSLEELKKKIAEEKQQLVKSEIKKHKHQLQRHLEDLRQSPDRLEDDMYLDDVMEYYSEDWNNIDLRDLIKASLEEENNVFRSLRAQKKSKGTFEKLNKKEAENYDFQRLRVNVERQNYFKVARNFDSNLRVDYDQIKTLSQPKKGYNPYPDYTAPLAYKNLRYLTLETPTANILQRRQLLRPELSLEFNQQGRIAPRIPRIGTATNKSSHENSRPIFMIRKPLSTRYNPERRLYLQKHIPKEAVQTQIALMRKKYSQAEDRYMGSTDFKSDKRKVRLVGFELNHFSMRQSLNIDLKDAAKKVQRSY